jgi:hypothetical protein
MAPCSLRRVVAAVVLVLALPASASAATGRLANPSDQWLPHPDAATWDWSWSDSDYQTSPVREHMTVTGREGTTFTLSWTQTNAASGSTPTGAEMLFQQTDAGLVNRDYKGTPPPSQFPILCATAGPTCGNTLAGPFWMLIWGTRSPTLSEPLLKGTRWSSLGGASSDVASTNRYVGRATIKVPAFPKRIRTAKVVSEVTQAGAIGDPYGSGLRTVWWARGVGPVRIVFRHTGGEVTRAELRATSLLPRPLPSDANLLPLNRGDHATFRWRNSRYMRAWSRQRFDVSQVVNNSARVDVKHLSGPINVAGSYTFATRLSGVTHLSGFTKAATRSRFPNLGPRDLPSDQRRRFFTPFDLMVFGFSPVVPVYPVKGETWRSSRDDRDWKVFGVTGRSKIVGTRKVKTPAGRFKAVVVTSTLRQKGYRFGSGKRTMWFAPGKGLVKLKFRHADRSVSTVERLK